MITQKELAKRLGCSRSTISRALKNSDRISLAMRQRIQETASELGYREDPALSALNAYRENGRLSEKQEVVALVTSRGKRRFNFEYYSELFAEMQAYAQRQNIRIDEFPFYEYEKEERLYKVLLNRRVSGVIFTEMRNPMRYPSKEFLAQIPCVAVDEDPRKCPVDVIDIDYPSGCRLLIEELVSRGYERIGEIHTELHRTADYHIDESLRYYRRLYCRPDCQIPVLYLSSHFNEIEKNCGLDLLEKWMKEFKPDAVVSSMPFPWKLLTELGYRIPEDLGFATLRNWGRDYQPGLFGLESGKVKKFNTAIDVLRRRFYGGRVDEAPSRLSILLEPEISEGATVRPKLAERAVPSLLLPPNSWRDRVGYKLEGKYYWQW